MPKDVTPNTSKTMPSFCSQFVPSASSKAETLFIRSRRVGFVVGTRSGDISVGTLTRAAIGGAAGAWATVLVADRTVGCGEMPDAGGLVCESNGSTVGGAGRGEGVGKGGGVATLGWVCGG